MAASTQRDIKLNIAAGVTGSEQIHDLAQDVRSLAKEGSAAAPQFDALANELDHAAARGKALAEELSAARVAFQRQKQAVTEAKDALSLLRAETSRAARGSAEFEAAERPLRVALANGNAELRRKREELFAATAASKSAAAAQAELVSRVDAATSTLRKQGQAAEGAAQQQVAANKRVRDSLQGIGDQLRTVQQLAGAALGGQLVGGLVGDLAKTADAYANLSARIKLAAGDGVAFNAAMDGVQAIAQRTGSSLETTADLFAKISMNTKSLGLSTADTLNVVESVTQAIQLSGVSAESASGALTQFAQALASGTLRGDELNSVLEGAPRLARALADGLGVTTGKLREMGAAGQLTSEQVIGALQGQSDALRREFEELPATVGRAITNLSSAWTVYLGEADKANGASAAAASAINFLAGNLDTLGSLLYSAGKAAAAYQALKLAQTFLGIGSAAQAATAAVTAYTAAQSSAAAAAAGSAASAGRFAALLGGLKVGTLITIATNFQEIGTWIGEGVAKLQGYGKALENAEIAQRADAEASRLASAERAALAHQTKQAEDAALGLTDVSRSLVAEFDKARKGGDSVADSLAKVAKAMNLSDASGIAAAGAALDALVLKSQASSEQIRAALSAALKSEDLGIFEAQSHAAFDGSEQGARRLAAALDALADESLRRAGTSVRELKTGFSAASTSAINDVDALAASLEKLGVTGDRASSLLSRSLDQAMSAARTEEAVKALMQRYEDLGRRALLTGRDMAEGMDAARAKLDSLKAGINSTDEALQAFGFKSRSEIKATADRLGEAWQRIANDTSVSLQQQRAAFEQWAAAATAANKGVEPSAVALARRMLEVREAGLRAGDGIASGMRKGQDAVEGLIASTDRLLTLQDQQARQQAALNGTRTAGNIGPEQTPVGSDQSGRGPITGQYDIGARAALISKRDAGTLTAGDLNLAMAYYMAARGDVESMNASRGRGFYPASTQRDIEQRFNEATGFLDEVKRLAGLDQQNQTADTSPQRKVVGNEAGRSTASSVRTIRVELGGRATQFTDLSESNAQALEDLLGQLEQTSRRSA